MTFTEIQTEIAARLNVTAPEALTRIGREINSRYRRVTSSVGLAVSRRSTVLQACTAGVQTVTFSGLTRVDRVFDDSTGTVRGLRELTVDQIRSVEPGTSEPTAYAIYQMGADSVTILLDVLPQDTRQLTADGLAASSTLSGSTEPAFSEDFHDLLVEGVMADELRKMEKRQLANDAEALFERRLSELRLFIAKSGYLKIQQNGQERPGRDSVLGSGGGAGTSGGTSYSQTGLITFLRAPSAPFAVQAGSAYVANLIAASINGQGDLATLDTVATAQIDDDSVTFAKMQNLSAAVVLGRTSASGGDPQELSPTVGLEVSGTNLKVVPNDAQMLLAARTFEV